MNCKDDAPPVAVTSTHVTTSIEFCHHHLLKELLTYWKTRVEINKSGALVRSWPLASVIGGLFHGFVKPEG
jgi:hypothetical protein